jgi:PIN domain nuclease of toxin-antitoxin system
VRLLLDTQAFLWAIFDQPRLSTKARKLFQDSGNELLLSLASIWEIAIKVSIGKLALKESFEQFIPAELQINQITRLTIDFRHIARVAVLPFHHRDPFDRLIAAQALEEKLPILSADAIFDRYAVKRLW